MVHYSQSWYLAWFAVLNVVVIIMAAVKMFIRLPAGWVSSIGGGRGVGLGRGRGDRDRQTSRQATDRQIRERDEGGRDRETWTEKREQERETE